MDVIFVTGNDVKVEMAQRQLERYDVRLRQKNLDIDEIQSDSLEAICQDKASKAHDRLEQPVVVMDAGLFIPQFNGFPGPYTSYVEDMLGLDGLLELIDRPTPARIQQTVAYRDKKHDKTFTSERDGRLLTEKRGNGYFFDSVFEVGQTGKTLAEMEGQERARAWGDRWEQFGEWWQATFEN